MRCAKHWAPDRAAYGKEARRCLRRRAFYIMRWNPVEQLVVESLGAEPRHHQPESQSHCETVTRSAVHLPTWARKSTLVHSRPERLGFPSSVADDARWSVIIESIADRRLDPDNEGRSLPANTSQQC